MKTSTIYKLLIILTIVGTNSATKLRAQEQVDPTVAMEPYYDLKFDDAERDSMQSNLNSYQEMFKQLHAVQLDNSVPMALYFDPIPNGFVINTTQKPIDWGMPSNVALPSSPEEIAFLPVYKLAGLIKSRKLTSLQLTQIYLDRLKRYSDTLQCVITLMEQHALARAREADAEIAKGKYRGPLHGIPFGIKDLLAVEGTKTTWGAAPYKDQHIDRTATVVKKLETAGAVLVAKLTLGALAMGDIWYGGVTKNPWNLKQGSSGSSAGSASATAAGLVGFAIGTETLGSIVSPSTRCGVTGLRPTFGAVSRSGAMTLVWSMDKIGPLCRSALDCALVFDAIRGEDNLDRSVHNFAFNYSAKADIKKLRIGYVKSLFDKDYPGKANDQQALETLRSLGVELIPVELPEALPVASLRVMLSAEAAAAFDELTRSGRDSLLVNQRRWAWPNSFRSARFIPAVEYINASRVRSMLIEAYYETTKSFDVIVAPSFGGSQLLTTNLTGNPCLVMPNGFSDSGSPTSISFVGRLYGEASLIALGRAYQQASDWDDKHPELFK